MTKLDGSVLGRLEPELTPEQFASAYGQIGQLLREFHRIQMGAFGYIGPNGIWTAHSTNHAYLSFQFDRKLKEFISRGGAAPLAERVAAHVADRAQPPKCIARRRCYATTTSTQETSLPPRLAAAVRLSGVLDFEGALAGDPLMDVAKSLYYLGDEPKLALLEGYGDPGRRWWRETLAFYHLYFVLELWCWMAQIGNKQPLEKLAQDLERCSTA